MTDPTAPCTSLTALESAGSPERAEDRRALSEFTSLPNEEYVRRLELARAGDPQTLEWVRRAFAADPTGKLEKLYGRSAANQIEDMLLAQAGGDDELARVSLLTQVDRLRGELAGPEPSPLERVLADRVTLTWMALLTLELQYERARHEMGPQLAEAMERRIGRLNRQFNEACKTLAVVRRLAVPAIRMFLAERQVNVLGEPRPRGG